MLVPCDGHLKGLVKKFGTIVRHQASKRDGLCGVSCHLDVRSVNDWWERCWLTREPPGNERSMANDLLLPFQPQCHLSKLILEVGGFVRIFRKVNMKSLGVLRVVVVGCAVVPNRLRIVLHGMEFWDVETIADSEFFKNVLILVKCRQRRDEEIKSLFTLDRELGDVEEIENATNSPNDPNGRGTTGGPHVDDDPK